TADEHRQNVVEGAAGVQIDIVRLPRDFRQQSLIFLVQRSPAASKGVRRRLRSKRLETIENRRNIAQATVNNLKLADAVVGVGNALRELRHAAAETVCDGQTSCIVAAAVDAVTSG